MDKVKKRDRLEVIHDILRIISQNKNSIKPTPLLRYSNLSTQNFSTYINYLISNNLIREIEDKKNKKHFTLTDKGFLYLKKYETIKGFIEEFNL